MSSSFTKGKKEEEIETDYSDVYIFTTAYTYCMDIV